MPHQPLHSGAPEIFISDTLAVSPLYSAEQLPVVRQGLLNWRRRQAGLAFGAVLASAAVLELVQAQRAALAREGINLVQAPGLRHLATEAQAWLAEANRRAERDGDHLAKSADDMADPD